MLESKPTDILRRSLVSQTMRGVGWSGISQVTKFVLQIVIGAILARLLLPSDFGLIGMVAVFSGVVGMFADLGLGSAIIQRKDVSEEHLSSVFFLNIFAGLMLSLLMLGLAPGIAYFYKENKLVSIGMVLGTRFFISSFAIVQRSLFAKKIDFKKIATAEVTSESLGGGLAIFLALSGMGAWSIVIQSVTSSTVNVILLWSLSKWRPRLIFRWDRLKELLGFSLNLLGSRFINYFARNSDNLLIGKFIGATALGYYNKAYTLMLLPLDNISWVFSGVLFPALSSIQNDIPKIRDKYLQSTRYISAVTFPIMLGVMIVAPELIKILYGP